MPRTHKAICTHGWPWFACPECDYLVNLSRAIMAEPAEYWRWKMRVQTIMRVRGQMAEAERKLYAESVAAAEIVWERFHREMGYSVEIPAHIIRAGKIPEDICE